MQGHMAFQELGPCQGLLKRGLGLHLCLGTYWHYLRAELMQPKASCRPVCCHAFITYKVQP